MKGSKIPMFVDTNILVSARAVGSPHHNAAAGMLARAFQAPEPARISRQIVREYLAVVTRPQDWADPLTADEAVSDVNRMLNTYQILEDGPTVTSTLLALLQDTAVGGRQIHDANIVATMLAYGERRLLTFNTADFRRFGDRIELISS